VDGSGDKCASESLAEKTANPHSTCGSLPGNKPHYVVEIEVIAQHKTRAQLLRHLAEHASARWLPEVYHHQG